MFTNQKVFKPVILFFDIFDKSIAVQHDHLLIQNYYSAHQNKVQELFIIISHLF